FPDAEGKVSSFFKLRYGIFVNKSYGYGRAMVCRRVIHKSQFVPPAVKIQVVGLERNWRAGRIVQSRRNVVADFRKVGPDLFIGQDDRSVFVVKIAVVRQ